jgi:hypothetical protein
VAEPVGLTVYGPFDGESASGAAITIISDQGDADGAGATISNAGIRIQMNYDGEDWAYSNTPAILILSPQAEKHVDSSISDNTAIWILDQEGFDASSSAVVRIDAQTCAVGGSPAACGDGDRGAFAMVGGTWNTGHIVLGGTGGGGGHLYYDPTHDTMKLVGNGPPYSAAKTQGVAIVTGSNQDTHGPAMWGISDAASFDSGNELCDYNGSGQGGGATGGVGMTCKSVINFATIGTPAVAACTDTFASGVYFIAMCK